MGADIETWREVVADFAVELDNDIEELRQMVIAGEWERAMGAVADLSTGIRCMWRLDDKVRDEEGIDL